VRVGRTDVSAEAPEADLVDRRLVCSGVDVVEEGAVLHVLVDGRPVRRTCRVSLVRSELRRPAQRRGMRRPRGPRSPTRHSVTVTEWRVGERVRGSGERDAALGVEVDHDVPVAPMITGSR
jgi:hypothetical protein